ncbi:MAG: alpha/beta hydrolase [Candidatus Omnitrophota bacterium]
MCSKIRPVLVVILSVMFLAGCSSLPMQKTRAYVEDLYSRVQYKKEGFYRTTGIFYATSQKAEIKEDSSLYFCPELAKEPTYGQTDVRIDPRIRIGKMSPERLKREELVNVQDIRELKEDVFLKKVAEAVKAAPHRSLLVLVFGYKDNFESTAIKAAYFSYLLDVNTPVLLFGWPGDQPVSISGYKKAQRLATASGPYLGELLTAVIRKVKPEKLWIHSSSLGCQVVCDAFEYMYKYDDLSDKEVEIANVVMAAPDVNKDEFDNRFQKELTALSDNLTAYVSSDDEALLISGWIDQEKKFGLQRIKEHQQFEEAKDLLYLKSLEPDKFAVVDVTPINTASYRHGYYLEEPAYFDDVYIRVLGKKPHTNRRLFLMKTKDDVDYLVLRGFK